MDLSTLVGWVLAVILIVAGIKVPKLGNFWDLPSVEIVVGGTIAGLIACYPFSMIKNVPKHLRMCFKGNIFDIPKTVDKIVELAMVARQNGLLALEEKADEIQEPFFHNAVLMIVDANDPDKVRYTLERQLDDKLARHEEVRGMYLKGSALAPAFGMIGTLIGLINMLKGMNLSGSGGASTLGQDMSVALITTFYGSSLSNVLFHPIAQKLAVRNSEEELYCSTIIEGVISIQNGDNPKTIRENLLSSLETQEAVKLIAEEPKSSSGNNGGE